MITIVSKRRFAVFVGIFAVAVGGTALIVGKTLWGSATIQKNAEFIIKQGESANQVWTRLVEEDITLRKLPWRYYAARSNAAGHLQAGVYIVQRGERVQDVLERFVAGDSTPNELVITYPEGFTLVQMAARTAASNIGTAEEFEAAAQAEKYHDEFVFTNTLSEKRSLEGYLFPDTYRVFEDDTSEDVVRRMLATFSQKVIQAGIVSGETSIVRGKERTRDEIIIMASIVEREVQHDEDMALIAGILWKRLDEDMGLDADATIRYIANDWENPLTVTDLAIDSPYNTRRYRGLPPGPISNPGIRAITAATNPQESEFYYYLSAPDGTTVFAKTNEEHNENKFKYLR